MPALGISWGKMAQLANSTHDELSAKQGHSKQGRSPSAQAQTHPKLDSLIISEEVTKKNDILPSRPLGPGSSSELL